MKNSLAKSKAPSAEDGADVLAQLDERLAELEVEDRALLAELIELESAGVAPKESAPNSRAQVIADAEAILSGAPVPAAAPAPPEVRAWNIKERRTRIRAAIDLGNRRAFRLRVAAADEVAEDMHSAWAKNIRTCVEHVHALVELAAERARLKGEWHARSGGMPHPFPIDAQADRGALGNIIVGDRTYEFLQAAKNAGLEER